MVLLKEFRKKSIIFQIIHCPLGDFLREKYDEATQVKMNKRGYLQVKDSRYKLPTALDLVYLDESPDWCRNTKQLQWPGSFDHFFPIYLFFGS